MDNKDEEFDTFDFNTPEELIKSISNKVWKDIDDLTTLTNTIDHDYVEPEETEKYIHIDSLIENLIISNHSLFPHQNKYEWEKLRDEFRKLLGTTATTEDQFNLGIYQDEVKFIRSYLKEKITPKTPFQDWECSYQFNQSLYNAIINVWDLILNAIAPIQNTNRDSNDLTSLHKLATRKDFREIIKKRPLLYFYLDETLEIPKRNKLKLFPNSKLTGKDRDGDVYKFFSEDLQSSNDYSINYKDQSIQINSIFLNQIALADISNRQIIPPIKHNIEYLQNTLVDVNTDLYTSLSLDYFNISLHLNQVYLSNEELIKLGINKPEQQSKYKERSDFLIQFLQEHPEFIDVDGKCTLTQDEIWNKCEKLEKELFNSGKLTKKYFNSGKSDFFNNSKNPYKPDAIKHIK